MARGAQELVCPGGVVGDKRRLCGLRVVDVVVVTGSIEPFEQRLELQRDGLIGGA